MNSQGAVEGRLGRGLEIGVEGGLEGELGWGLGGVGVGGLMIPLSTWKMVAKRKAITFDWYKLKMFRETSYDIFRFTKYSVYCWKA